MIKQSKLLGKTVALLKATTVPYTKIASDMGFNIRWVHMVKDGDIKDPSVNRIEALYEYLLKN